MKNMRYIVLALVWFAVSVPGCKTGPPKETGPFREPELVELVKLDTTIHLDIRYATPNNFTGHAVYSQARAFLQKPAAEALIRVSRKLQEKGYGLLVFDGYRPWYVTKEFWDIASEQQRKEGFVANPAKGSRHNRGCAVDLSLYTLANGSEVTMPSPYDDFTEKAYSDYRKGNQEPMRLRDILRSTMEADSFKVLKEEWWHFDYNGWASYPIMNIPFEKL
jgi:zinc D-Ala-D-Ala dipeptidase